MQEIYKELLYREIGKVVMEAIETINVEKLADKAAIRALKEIENVITDDEIAEDVKSIYRRGPA